MMKLFSIAAVVLIAALGCKKATEATQSDFDKSVVVQGDHTKCKIDGPIPVNGNLIGIWTKVDWRETTDIQYSTFLEFKNTANSMEMAMMNYCTVKKIQRSALASVSSPVLDRATSLTILQSLSKTTNETIGGTPISCDVAITAGTYLYQFDGACLVVEGDYYIRK